ncbi:MAG: DUF4402 domain-containing protein [Pseudomonadota bacterium]
MRALTKSIAALIALSAPVATAYGQGADDPDAPGDMGAVILNGLRVQLRQDLDFGVIAPSLTQTGTVFVRRGKNRTSECSTELTCLETGNRARFTVIGEPERVVTITDPVEIIIENSNGATMRIDGFVGAGSGNDTEWRGRQTLKSSGISRFNVGATLHVAANQEPGDYIGTFPIVVEYE